MSVVTDARDSGRAGGAGKHEPMSRSTSPTDCHLDRVRHTGCMMTHVLPPPSVVPATCRGCVQPQLRERVSPQSAKKVYGGQCMRSAGWDDQARRRNARLRVALGTGAHVCI